MEKKLSPQQIEAIKEAHLKEDKVAIENQIIKLIVAGFDEYTAEYLVNKVIKEYREELFRDAEEKKENENEKHIADCVVLFASVSGSIFGVTNPAWYLFVVIVCGIAGYLGYNEKPLAGMIRSIVIAGLFPVTFNFFFGTRSEFRYIELLLPLGICFIVGFGFQYLIGKMFYPDKD